MLRSSGPALPPTNTHPVRTHRVGAGHSSSCTSVGAAGKPGFGRVLRLARPLFPRSGSCPRVLLFELRKEREGAAVVLEGAKPVDFGDLDLDLRPGEAAAGFRQG